MLLKLWYPYVFRSLPLAIAFLIGDSLKAQTASKLNLSGSTSSLSTIDEIQPLKVGDKVPNIEIDNIINFPFSYARLSDFRNKLILIDFWGTNCSNCIAALPKIDTLQAIYKDKIQVFTVANYDTREKVVATLQRFKKTRNLQLPIVLNDVKLKKYFPHELLSHVIWIDGNGIVKAITGTEYINARNIQTILDGKEINWPVKNDVLDFDYEKPFLGFSNSNVAQPDFIYSSAFTGNIEGIDATDKLFVDSINNTVTRNHFNHDLLQLCDGSLNGSGTGYINLKFLALNVKDPGRYVRDANRLYYAEWEKKNTYCYSITLPLNLSEEQTREIVKTDLTHWLNVLGIKVMKEKRLMNCLLLVRTDKNDDLLKSKGGKYEFGLNEPGTIKFLQDANISYLVAHLNQEISGIPWVIDETHLPDNFNVDLSLHINSFENIPAVRKELHRYGLDLIEGKKEMEMYIITEKGVMQQ